TALPSTPAAGLQVTAAAPPGTGSGGSATARSRAHPLTDRLQRAARGAAVDRVEELDRARRQLAGRGVFHLASQRQVDQRVGRADGVVGAVAVLQIEAQPAVGPPEPARLALDVDQHLALGADRPHLELVLVAA